MTSINECESSFYKTQKLQKFEYLRTFCVEGFEKLSMGRAITFTKWVLA